MRRLYVILMMVIVTGVLGAAALAQTDEELTGIGGTYWTRQYSEDTTAGCVTTSTTSSTCMLVPAGDVFGDGVNPLRRALAVTFGGAGRCCYMGLTSLNISGTQVSDASGAYGSGPGACPFVAETSSGGRFDDRPDLRFLIAAQTHGMPTGLCSAAIPNSGDSLYAPCRTSTNCDSPYGGGTCTAWASTTSTQRARAGLFLICDSDSGSITITVRKQNVTK